MRKEDETRREEKDKRGVDELKRIREEAGRGVEERRKREK